MDRQHALEVAWLSKKSDELLIDCDLASIRSDDDSVGGRSLQSNISHTSMMGSSFTREYRRSTEAALKKRFVGEQRLALSRRLKQSRDAYSLSRYVVTLLFFLLLLLLLSSLTPHLSLFFPCYVVGTPS